MTTDELDQLEPGRLITLFCRTSAAHIYYAGEPNLERVRFTPTDTHLRAISYLIEGSVSHLDHRGKLTFLVLDSYGPAANFDTSGAHVILKRKPVIRNKQISVPITAIQRYRYDPA